MALKKFPPAPRLKKLLGPSFIILALGLGSGEIILWPYLVSNYGLGVAWGAVLGISFQFFINMEIERYALVKGESVFVGIGRFLPVATYWFIISTFIGFGLPGIAAASAQVLAGVFGLEDFKLLAIGLLLLIGFILTFGRVIYSLMERITKIIIFIGVPAIFFLAVFLSSPDSWQALAWGMVGRGEGYWFFAPGVAIATFLGAFAYSGAGGNLNLTQSIYVKEKGYGMGLYSQKITGLFAQKNVREGVKLEGESFKPDKGNIRAFQSWWKLVNREHFLIFWLIGSVSMLMLMFLAYNTAFGLSGNEQGISFVLAEGGRVGAALTPLAGLAFLAVLGVMLFQTQLGIMDSTSRIMGENAAIIRLRKVGGKKIALSKYYYAFVWLQIAFGVSLFLLDYYEPKTLIVLGAVINAFAMLVHIVLVTVLNQGLEKPFRPKIWRLAVIGVIIAFFAVFCTVVLKDLWA
ncbi:MAG: Nramp family divalent metal transporter [Bacillota bacterium]